MTDIDDFDYFESPSKRQKRSSFGDLRRSSSSAFPLKNPNLSPEELTELWLKNPRAIDSADDASKLGAHFVTIYDKAFGQLLSDTTPRVGLAVEILAQIVADAPYLPISSLQNALNFIRMDGDALVTFQTVRNLDKLLIGSYIDTLVKMYNTIENRDVIASKYFPPPAWVSGIAAKIQYHLKRAPPTINTSAEIKIF